MRSSTWLSFVVVLLVSAACGGGDGGRATATSTTTTTMSVTTSPTTSSTTATSTTITTTTSTITTEAPCGAGAMLAFADAAVVAARLPAWDVPWGPVETDTAFAERTVDPGGFAAGLALDCSLLVQQLRDDGAERLVLAAWTGERMTFVIQATDTPDPPFAEEVRFDLLMYWVDGEWIGDQVWAGTLADGETLILGTVDYPIGAVAKAWQVAFPEPPPAPPTIDAEADAIAALEAAGARNVGVAQPADTDVAMIAFMTPRGSVMIATVGPIGSLPAVAYLTGDTTNHVLSGVDVTLTLPGPDQYDVGQTVFTCEPYVWWINSSFGTADEVLEWTAALVASLPCS